MAHRKRSKAERQRKEEEQRSRGARETRRLVTGIGVIVSLFALLGYALATGLIALPAAPASVALGRPAPDFVLRDVDGVEFRLSDQQGRVVLLDFMGSRCSACVVEMPHLVETHERYSSQGLVILSIDVGGSISSFSYLGTTNAEEARKFLRDNGGTWQIALDTARVGITYHVAGLPTIYLIGPDGVVRWRGGLTTGDVLTAQIEPLL